MLFINSTADVVSAVLRSWYAGAFSNHGRLCLASFDHPCEAVRCCNPKAPKPLISLVQIEFLDYR